MKNLYYDDFEDFACAVADSYDTLDYEDDEDVVIIAKYEEARQIIKELLCLGYDAHSIEIHDDLWENYDAEYIVSLYENEVWCEPMLRENGYLNEDAPIIYVLDNCSSKVIPHCKGKNVFEVSIGEEETSDGEGYAINGETVSKEKFDEYVSQFKAEDNKAYNCDKRECACQKDENPDITSTTTTTTSAKSIYKVNGKEVTKEEFDRKCEQLEEKYLDNIRDMLLNHLEFQQEMDEWKRLFRW